MIKHLIDQIIETRAKGNAVLISTTKTKLTLKGIDPSKYSETSNDDPVMIAKIVSVAREMGVKI